MLHEYSRMGVIRDDAIGLVVISHPAWRAQAVVSGQAQNWLAATPSIASLAACVTRHLQDYQELSRAINQHAAVQRCSASLLLHCASRNDSDLQRTYLVMHPRRAQSRAIRKLDTHQASRRDEACSGLVSHSASASQSFPAAGMMGIQPPPLARRPLRNRSIAEPLGLVMTSLCLPLHRYQSRLGQRRISVLCWYLPLAAIGKSSGHKLATDLGNLQHAFQCHAWSSPRIGWDRLRPSPCIVECCALTPLPPAFMLSPSRLWELNQERDRPDNLYNSISGLCASRSSHPIYINNFQSSASMDFFIPPSRPLLTCYS
ncbi:hypothetical protein B0H67DRAFT_365715 [Lasiosphaeris hirsuta]|uniref:Uncharacterized protein n=1 Tax=Lasiosphaeris hirsuta TaxID=260670 RepID=A0AA39ZWH3_9PEZI|nr:hypothetical protein B0H67DRAFT_365715 [Lasiosphaeris hirsuta]